MITHIEVKPDTYLAEILLAEKYEFASPVSLLFGGNGVGKSTLIKAILGNEDFHGQYKGKIDTDKAPMLYEYINSNQNARELMGGRNKHMKYLDYFDPRNLATTFNAQELSEGQSIIYTIQEFLHLAKQVDDPGGSVFVIDEIDSGLSADNIIWFCNQVKKITDKDQKLQFIIAFNNFEVCNCFGGVVTDMYTGEIRTIKDYNEYKQLLVSRRKNLLEKRDYNQFRDYYMEDKE